VIAQQLEEVLPELVDTDNDGYKSVDYTSLIGLLIRALQEKDQEIEKLRIKTTAELYHLQSQIDQIIKTQISQKNKRTAP